MRWPLQGRDGRRERSGAGTRRCRPVLHLESYRLEPRMLLSNVSVLQYRDDDGNTGQNLSETVLTPSDVNPTDFGKLYSYPVDGYIYAEPLYMANLAIPGQGTHNVVFVATENDSVYAFDADGGVGASGAPLWHDSFINPAKGITPLDQSDVFGAFDITPEIGITATPVIDQATGALYVVTKTKDIENGVEHIVQDLYALNVANGAEMFGGPVVIADTTVNPDGSYIYNSGPSVAGTGAGSVDGVLTFNALTQFDRGALVLDDGVVYLSFSSHGDNPPNHGWVLGYNAQNLQQAAIFCTTPNGSDGTIWGAGEGLAQDPEGDLYFVTGNGTFETTLDADTGFPIDGDYGDSVVKIAADPTSTAADPNINGWGLKVLDYFTPTDQETLDDNDLDFGSGGPLLLPATATGPPVLLAAGKEGTIFVIDTDTGKMGEYNPNQDDVYQEIQGQIKGIWGTPVYFDGSVYYGPVGDHIKAFQLQADNLLSTTPTSESPQDFGYPGPNPVTSANGTSDGIVWAIGATAWGSQGPDVLYAYNAVNLADVLYSSAESGSRDTAPGAVKFTVPLVTNGMVYVGGEYSLAIYGELAGVAVPAAPTQLTATSLSNAQVKLSWQYSSDNETGFTIERSTDGVHFSPVGTVGPYVDTDTDLGLSSSTRYDYQVIATNSAGSSLPSNGASATTAAPTLPAPWTDADIGGPSVPGAASYAAGVFSLNSSGSDIGNAADQFNYVYQTLTGDGTIIARVDSEEDTNPSAQAGVMIRQSLDADSPYVDAIVMPGNAVELQWRSSQGAASASGAKILDVAPYWVKLVRAGATITGYSSPNGVTWTSLGSTTAPMSTQVYVGLCLSSASGGLLNDSTFDYVRLTQATPIGYLAIDAGGGPAGTYPGDQDASGGETAQTTNAIVLSETADPAPMGAYQTSRVGTFTYTIPGLTAGNLYVVRLHFSEDSDTTVGERIFDVSINGKQVLTNFDILATAGSMFTAIVEEFSAVANAEGQMIIAFSPAATSPDQNADINGIEVIPLVFNQRILAQPVALAPMQEGESFSGEVASFVDTDPGGLPRNYIATIMWGDGTTTTGNIQRDPSGSGYDVVGTHTYETTGAIAPKVVIQANDGSAVELDLALTVEDPLDSIGIPTSYSIPAGASTGPIVVGTFTDTIASPPAFSTSIVWGDGMTGTGSIVAFSGGYLVVASHNFASAGTYVPQVRVTSGGVPLAMDNTTIVVAASSSDSTPTLVTTGAGPSPTTTVVTTGAGASPAETATAVPAGPSNLLGGNPFTGLPVTAAHGRKSHKPGKHIAKHHLLHSRKLHPRDHHGKKAILREEGGPSILRS